MADQVRRTIVHGEPGAEPFWELGGELPRAGGSVGQFEYVPGDGIPEASGRGEWSAWDKMTIAGVDVPGLVVVVGRHTKRYDEKHGQGDVGSTFTNLGYDPAEVDITVTIWTPAQWLDWQTKVLPVIKPKIPPHKIAAGRPQDVPVFGGVDQVTVTPQVTVEITVQPVQVYHPALAAMGISALFIHDVGLPVPGAIVGTKSITIRAKEWAPVVSAAISTPTGSLQSNLDRFPSQTPQASQPVTRPDLDPGTTGP